MQTVVTSGIAIVLAAALYAAPALAWQEQPPRTPEQKEQAKDPMPATGELVAHDPNAKTFAIKSDAGSAMKFSYTAETEIVGGEKDVSGLATMSGSIVTVHYTFHGTANTATKIELKPKR